MLKNAKKVKLIIAVVIVIATILILLKSNFNNVVHENQVTEESNFAYENQAIEESNFAYENQAIEESNDIADLEIEEDQPDEEGNDVDNLEIEEDQPDEESNDVDNLEIEENQPDEESNDIDDLENEKKLSNSKGKVGVLDIIFKGKDIFETLKRDDKYREFLWYAVDDLGATAPALVSPDTPGHLGVISYENVMNLIEDSFKFLKKPDGKSYKVQYDMYEGTITYERFSKDQIMYAKNPSSTDIYKFSKIKPYLVNRAKFGEEKIYVNGIANGYADTNKGFINIKDLMSTKPILVKDIVLNKTNISVVEGETAKLKASVSPDNATDRVVTWSSRNERVATIDKSGNIKTFEPGSSIITAKSSNGKTVTCILEVKPIVIKSVKLNKSSTTIAKGKTEKLTATIKPTPPSGQTIRWYSSNPKVATVEEYGKGTVTAVGAGTAIITAKSSNGKAGTCKVTVTNPVVSVKLNKESTTIIKGRTEKLAQTISPKNATNKNVTWSSSNTKVATVDGEGNVKAVGSGTATITVTTKDGNKKSTCKVKVKNPYKTRKVNVTVNLPKSFKQKHYVEILDGNNKAIWTSVARTGSSSYGFTYQLDTSSSSYSRKIRIRTVSGNKKYDSNLFKINSSTINKNVTATFAAKTTNSLQIGKITQK